MSSFNLDSAFPNMDSHAYDFRVDHYEPNRVWFTIRNTGTHTGPLKFLGRTIQPTGKVRCHFIVPCTFTLAVAPTLHDCLGEDC